jgi:hypothetical protein
MAGLAKAWPGSIKDVHHCIRLILVGADWVAFAG